MRKKVKSKSLTIKTAMSLSATNFESTFEELKIKASETKIVLDQYIQEIQQFFDRQSPQPCNLQPHTELTRFALENAQVLCRLFKTLEKLNQLSESLLITFDSFRILREQVNDKKSKQALGELKQMQVGKILLQCGSLTQSSPIQSKHLPISFPQFTLLLLCQALKPSIELMDKILSLPKEQRAIFETVLVQRLMNINKEDYKIIESTTKNVRQRHSTKKLSDMPNSISLFQCKDEGGTKPRPINNTHKRSFSR